MTVVVEGQNSFFVGTTAQLLGSDHELAWAEKYVKRNPAFAYVMGNYVQADTPNLNRQFWTLDHLQVAQASIQYAPLNMLHRFRYIVGTYIASEMMYPKDAAADSAQKPYIEALGVFWRYYFPNEYKAVEAAYASGQLFMSMECIAKSITCYGEGGCGVEYEYRGPISDTYCAHLNGGESIKHLKDPHFLAGALIFPPERPGWKGAAVTEISQLVKDFEDEAERLYVSVAEETPHLGPKEWESIMVSLLSAAKLQPATARDYSQPERKKLAKKGQARGDGSFPIVTAQDLRNAIQAIGRAKDPAAAKRHIIARAKALGLTSLLPSSWKN